MTQPTNGLGSDEIHTLTIFHREKNGPWYLVLDDPALTQGAAVPGSGGSCAILAKGTLQGTVVTAVDAEHSSPNITAKDGLFRVQLHPNSAVLEQADVQQACGIGAHVLGVYRREADPTPAKNPETKHG